MAGIGFVNPKFNNIAMMNDFWYTSADYNNLEEDYLIGWGVLSAYKLVPSFVTFLRNMSYTAKMTKYLRMLVP